MMLDPIKKMNLPFEKIRKSLNARLLVFRNERETKREHRALALLATTDPQRIRNASRSHRRNLQRAVELLNRKHQHLVRNWYESGNPYRDGSASYLTEVLTDARYDQNQITRREAMRRMRYWEQNSGFVKRTLDVGEQYVIGTHLPVVTSLSASPDWAAQAEIVFHEMCQDAGLNGESLLALMGVGYRRKKVDGNILFVETSKPGLRTIRRGTVHETQLSVMKPALQMVESHRVGTPFPMWAQEGQDIFDGVQYKTTETKLADGRIRRVLTKSHYWVNDSANNFSVNDGFTDVPVDKCYYASTAHRVNEPRGMTDFYAAEPTLALLEDLLKLEMRAQEVQSDIALFITNGAGQMVTPKMNETFGALGVRMSAGADGKPIATVDDIKKVQALYDKIWGGQKVVGRTGDTLTAMAPNRPAEATLNLWNFLIDLYCAAVNCPRILIFPKTQKGQGTEVRAEIEAANAAFIKEFNLVWKPFMHLVWKYFMGWAIKNDERVANAPADWETIEVSPPRSVVVDLGYEAAATIADLSAGITNLHFIAQKLGTTRSKLIEHSVRDVFDIKLACAKKAEQGDYKKYGITVDAAEVRNNLGDVAKNLAAQTAADKQPVTADVSSA